jgi:hypothetical protein
MRGRSTEQTVMRFGQYKGRKIRDIPPDYLMWMYRNCHNHFAKGSNSEILRDKAVKVGERNRYARSVTLSFLTGVKS